jgi:hypothetical protein
MDAAAAAVGAEIVGGSDELPLLLDDALGDLDDRPPPLLYRTDQPLRAAELLADELLRLGVLEHPLGEVLVDVEPLQALVVQIDAQFLGATGSQLILGQHAQHRFTNHPVRAIRTHALRGNFFQPARKSAVMAINFLFELVASQPDLIGIDDHDVVAAIRFIQDHAGEGIRANTVLHGAVPVGDFPADMPPVTGPGLDPERRLLGSGTAEDVAAAVLYLASPAARYITGQTLTLDGGFLIS